MKILNCPLNGPRNISEFVCLGEFREPPSPNAPELEWARYTFIEKNPAGIVREWWLHIATSNVFVAERDTRTDIILATFPPEQTGSSRRSDGGGV